MVTGPREVQLASKVQSVPVHVASAEKVRTQPPIVAPPSEDVASTLSQSAVVMGADILSPADVRSNELSGEEALETVESEKIDEEDEEF